MTWGFSIFRLIIHLKQDIMRTSPLLFIVLIAFVLAIAGCTGDGGGIPVDEQRVRSHVIKIDDAKRYKSNLSQGFRDSFNIPKSELFTRDSIAVLLNQEGATDIRIYFGRNDKGQFVAILVPVDKNGKDIKRNLLGTRTGFIPGVSSAYAWDEGEAIENGQRCPVVCDDSW